MKLVLYGYWRSSATWRVRIALHHKKLPFEYVPVDLIRDGGGQRSSEYHAKNPMEQVPCLEVTDDTGARLMTQSLPILELLEERFPSPSLLPRDPWMRAHVRRLAEIVNSGIQPFQNLLVLDKLKTLGVDPRPWLRDFIGRGLGALEETARPYAGAFLVGDEPTFADCCLVPQMYAARRFGFDPAPLETLMRVEQACAALPAFHAAHADAQPDAGARS